MHLSQDHYPVVCFGEVLWDILPSGPRPGGAPMNVAFHLKRLGIDPALITRIGRDDRGARLRGIMNANGISTRFFQLDQQLPTGQVNATETDDHEMVYDIIDPVAWDNIQWDQQSATLVSNARYFVFGTLAARNQQSRKTLFSLLEAARLKVLDVNLRPPHYDRTTIKTLLKDLHLLKINLAELKLITDWLMHYTKDTDRIKGLQDMFDIRNIVVTKGANGAVFNALGHIYEHPGFKITVADTVGSGDAALAGLIAKLLQGKSPPIALQFASALGALVASHNGACPAYDPAELSQMISDTPIKIN